MTRTIYCLAMTVGLLGSLASGGVLMLNFGSTFVPGGEATNSPYHTVNSGFTDTTWNEVQMADIAGGGLVYSDGTTASGVALNLGSSTGGAVVDYNANPDRSGTLGDQGGIYSLTTMRSVVWKNGTPGSDYWVGIRIDGLAAGTYDVYAWGNNGNLTLGGTPMTVYASTAAQADTFDFSMAGNAVPNNDSTAWVDGVSYAADSIDLAAGQSLYLAIDGSNASQSRGFLSGVQIVSVPEPVTAAVLVMGGLAVLRRRRAA